jgi:large subunit ribosomal protein L21
MFAIIKTGGKQYKVAKGDSLDIERVEGKEDSTIKFSEVLLINDKKATKIGAPFIKDATVSGKITAHKRGEKIKVFKMKAKKRYKRTQGHRQELTSIEITDIK